MVCTYRQNYAVIRKYLELWQHMTGDLMGWGGVRRGFLGWAKIWRMNKNEQDERWRTEEIFLGGWPHVHLPLYGGTHFNPGTDKGQCSARKRSGGGWHVFWEVKQARSPGASWHILKTLVLISRPWTSHSSVLHRLTLMVVWRTNWRESCAIWEDGELL